MLQTESMKKHISRLTHEQLVMKTDFYIVVKDGEALLQEKRAELAERASKGLINYLVVSRK